MTPAEKIRSLIEAGLLVPVEVFGQGCLRCAKCQSGEPHPERVYGLSDAVCAWSDCNRADEFLLRPSDEAMTPELLGWLREIKDASSFPAGADNKEHE